jgi:hypothetical protein
VTRRNADEGIRELERRAEESGSTPDRAQLLAALVRSGRVDPWIVRAAAFVGHDAATLLRPAPLAYRDLTSIARTASRCVAGGGTSRATLRRA